MPRSTHLLSRPDGSDERQADRRTAFLERIEDRPLPGFDEAAAWLRAHKPIDYIPDLMHGDCQLTNVMNHGAPAPAGGHRRLGGGHRGRPQARPGPSRAVENPGAHDPAPGTVAWLEEDQQRAWRGVVQLFRRLPAALESELQRTAGLSLIEHEVLVVLSESPDRTCQMSELAAVTLSSLSRLSHVMSRLQKRGWVTRRDCPTDGRVTEAVLTASGMAKVMRPRRTTYGLCGHWSSMPSLRASCASWASPARRSGNGSKS